MIKVDDKKIQKALNHIDLRNRKDYVKVNNFKKFNVLNFDDSQEILEYDPATVNLQELGQIVATILKRIK